MIKIEKMFVNFEIKIILIFIVKDARNYMYYYYYY